MSDNTIEEPKVIPDDGVRKADWPTASTRVSPGELHMIDAAAYRTQKKRSELVYEAVMDRVRDILGSTAPAA